MKTVRQALVLVGLLALIPSNARGAEQCVSSVAEFNTYMDAQVSSASTVKLTFTVTGVNLDDYFNGKGWLAELADTRCSAGGGVASLKVYGNSSPLDTAHPPGTMKLEYGSYCCATAPCPVERWADPMPGSPIFSQPSQVCNVAETVTPSIVSYDIQCDGGTLYHAEGANTDNMPIDKAAVLSEVTGGHAMTNATATNVEICFELAGSPVGSQKVEVMEDVTVSPQYPTSVYPDANDLACGNGDGTTYLQFDLSSINGSIKKAALYVHSGADSSATGTGADVMSVGDTSWSEKTLTWNARPALGAKLGRIDGVSPDSWYTTDVSGAVKGPGKFAFALAPAATDADTAHFLSKEASTTLKPYLLLQVLEVDGDGDGYNDGPDCDDADPAVHPGAFESCDGTDNDCDGTIDDGCPGVGGAGGGGWSGTAGTIPKAGNGGNGASSGGTEDSAGGFACGVVGCDGARTAVLASLLSLLGLALLARRCAER
jgi:hypothetical protein